MAEVTLKEIYPVPEKFRAKAYIKSRAEYEKIWKESLSNPEDFWGKIAEEYVTWFKKWDKVMDCNYGTTSKDLWVRWFVNGKVNVSYNCLDRHLEKRGNQIALIWEGNEPTEDKKFTYKELHEQVCKFANVLKKNGVKKGDRVTFFLPMIPELAIGILACTRIGAVHSVVFGGFSAEALRDRIQDCKSEVLISCDGTFRGAKAVPQKDTADKAIAECPTVRLHIVVKRVGSKIQVNWNDKMDKWYEEEMANADANCPAEQMDAEDPLFILYTSGSTGKPKGVMHTTGGYLTYVAYTHKMIFDYHDGDIYWCTADVGWVTGHSYIVYGPLANGATTIMFEGVPTYPDFGRFWAIVEKYKVNIFYTAPTAIRALAKEGDSWVDKHDISSIQLLGSVGEPLNPEAWNWYYHKIGRGECPIVDTWWQTETGGILITPLPGAIDIKPAMATVPFFGVEPCIVDDNGTELEGVCTGNLCIKRAWPGQMRGVYGDPERFFNTYFTQFPGKYFTGDGAKRDKDGYYQITGRVDDVINVSGHRMGTAEIESALVAHPKVAEAAVVGYPHEIKGQSIYAFVTLNTGVEKSDELKKELVAHVRKEIGPIATPEMIQWADVLPKTRSGKIMRRILKKIAAGEFDKSGMGDTSTLADPTVVDTLINDAKKLQGK
ncbi:MAG TPA: acetate--CoA ligase [Spirochaetota bacterium]|nr:acetate--CoA ligase [Spirochaetota bacterium]HOR94203.1 acetate--CoA ligase [Spirochaetota bacterium]HOT18737.1 acetate--CoA ligase [Spirochaetota bacterium]HPD05671.1 acetate--CoA ligase [Spirochaetota bacterium]HQG43386.1 acetate--CoA ligase [Spirochaetota bacterium]